TASASGGTGSGYQFHWDLDGDGVVDRSGTQTQVRLSFPTATSTQVRVSVSDSSGCSGSASRALDVAGPRLQASAQPLQQLCGNGDSRVEPGERWRRPVRLQNTGNAPLLADSRALFVPGDGRSALGIGPDAHGYAATTSNEGQCAASFIDLAAGQHAVPQLALTDAGISGSLGARDDGRSAEPIALAAGVRVYGQPVSQAIMSTNGYLSFSDQESGGDFFNDCVGSVGNGSTRPRLHVMHDDLVAGATGTAGLRHRAFATCPRPADTDGPTPGCHVFQWDGMQLWDGGTPSGNYSFQAVLYQHSGQIVYQYRSAAAAEATIGLVAATPAAGLLNVLAPGSDCDDAGFLPQANSAVCVFDPAASP